MSPRQINRSTPRERAALRHAASACRLAWISVNTPSSTQSSVRDARSICSSLLLVLGRHSWRQQRRERLAIPRTGLPGLEFSYRGVSAGCLQDDLGRDVFSRGVDDIAVAFAKIRGSA